MKNTQVSQLKILLERAYANSPFYKAKFDEAGFCPSDFQTAGDITKIPLSSKVDLRNAYPLGIMAVPDEEIVRVHSSSGTTGKAIIMPYTKKDVDDWAIQMARCFEMAGCTNKDRIQITPGYGLWTAGIGFQAGAEKLGAMAIPTGPGNTEKQIQMMIDLQSSVIVSTSSYALSMGETIMQKGVLDKINLKKGVIGSERWGEKMRTRICETLGIELFDIYGLTEAYGPGIAIDCDKHAGMHYWDDYLYFEIIDPITEEVLPIGETGELVITTLVKEGAPLIRYRTRDITRLVPGECECGSKYPRLDRIVGRTDDMIKVKGVNIFPGQIDELLKDVAGTSSEYQVVLTHESGRDKMLLRVELEMGYNKLEVEQDIVRKFKQKIGILIGAEGLELGSLPRSEKKTARVFDHRFE